MVSPEILASLEGEGGLSAEELLERLCLRGLPSQEVLFNEIEESLLLPKTRLPDHWLGTYQVYALSLVFGSPIDSSKSHWDHPLQIPELLTLKPSPAPTSLTFQRVGLKGRVVGYVEVCMVTLYLLKSSLWSLGAPGRPADRDSLTIFSGINKSKLLVDCQSTSRIGSSLDLYATSPSSIQELCSRKIRTCTILAGRPGRSSWRYR
jgi:hypothetical protein